jgi:hypothetical protein
MMNVNMLPVNQKADILWEEGKFIGAIELNDYDVSLYSLDDQYYEMYYSVSKCRIEKITSLENPERFKRYSKNK